MTSPCPGGCAVTLQVSINISVKSGTKQRQLIAKYYELIPDKKFLEVSKLPAINVVNGYALNGYALNEVIDLVNQISIM